MFLAGYFDYKPPVFGPSDEDEIVDSELPEFEE
jgi:hypothetical protein